MQKHKLEKTNTFARQTQDTPRKINQPKYKCSQAIYAFRLRQEIQKVQQAGCGMFATRNYKRTFRQVFNEKKSSSEGNKARKDDFHQTSRKTCRFAVPTPFCAPQFLSPVLKSFGALCVAANGKDIDYTLVNVKKLRHTSSTRSSI